MFIRLGDWSNNMYLFILSPLIYCLRVVSYGNMISDTERNKKIIFTLPVIMFSGMLFGGGFGLFYKYLDSQFFRKKKSNVTKNFKELLDSNKVIDIIKPKETKNKVVPLLILACSFIDFETFTSPFLIYTSIDEKQVTEASLLKYFIRLNQLIFISIFYFLFLHQKIYKHQILSIIIISLFSIIGIFLAKIKINNEYLFSVISTFTVNTFMTPLKDVIEKYLMLNHNISIYYLSFFEGIIGLIFSFITFAIALITIESEFSSPEIWEVIVYFLTSGAYNITIKYIIFLFSPSHRSIGDITSILIVNIGLNILDREKNDNNTFLFCFFNILLYILILFFYFVYNDIIILDFCNLNSDTYQEIKKRGELETAEAKREQECFAYPKEKGYDKIEV